MKRYCYGDIVRYVKGPDKDDWLIGYEGEITCLLSYKVEGPNYHVNFGATGGPPVIKPDLPFEALELVIKVDCPECEKDPLRASVGE